MKQDKIPWVGPGRPNKPCTIAGVTYYSTEAAAKELGVSPTTLAARFKLLGSRTLTADDIIDRRKTPVKIRGTLYPTKKAAAEAIGVSPWTVYKALENGTVDSVGLGKKKK